MRDFRRALDCHGPGPTPGELQSAQVIREGPGIVGFDLCSAMGATHSDPKPRRAESFTEIELRRTIATVAIAEDGKGSGDDEHGVARLPKRRKARYAIASAWVRSMLSNASAALRYRATVTFSVQIGDPAASRAGPE